MKDITLVLMLVYIAVLHFGHKTSDTSGHPNSAVEHVFVPEPMMLLDFNNKMEAETVKVKNAYVKVGNELENNDWDSDTGDANTGDASAVTNQQTHQPKSTETDNFSDQENFDDKTTFGRDFSKTTQNLEPKITDNFSEQCEDKD